MSSTDFLQRFLFENHGVRGQFVRLQDTYQTVGSQRQYPEPVLHLLGQGLAAAALLSATIKYQGSLILQTQSSGPVTLMVIQCNEKLQMRALARYQDDASFSTSNLFGEGQMVITITPNNTTERYQGVVNLTTSHLASSLESYFTQSEQLPTRLWLVADEQHAVGMLLQKMPASQVGEKAAGDEWDYWEHIEHLANTISSQELLSLDNETLLHRLFHQEDIRLFSPQAIEFSCRCSIEKMQQALQTMGEAEVRSILSTNRFVEVTCDFCNKTYNFDEQAINEIWN